MIDIDLTDEQRGSGRILVNRVEQGLRKSSIAGSAGTGKTTLFRWLSEELVGRGWFVFYAAPTGKAASRLQSVVGSPVSTLHSLLYRRVLTSESGRPVFTDLRERLIEGQRGALIVDEASMIGVDVVADIQKAAGSAVMVVYGGDHRQLRPVAARPGIDLEHPDALLTTIHRQALDNPILSVASGLWEGRPMPRGKIGTAYERRNGTVLEAADWLADRVLTGADAVVICMTNKIRQDVNTSVRRLLGRSSEPLVAGDQIIILHNNKVMGVSNGETMTVDRLERYPGKLGDRGLCHVWCGEDRFLLHLPSLGKDLVEFSRMKSALSEAIPTGPLIHADFGYCLTPWKIQGSEYKEVCFLLDGGSRKRLSAMGAAGVDESRRIAYTSLTRAKASVLALDVP